MKTLKKVKNGYLVIDGSGRKMFWPMHQNQMKYEYRKRKSARMPENKESLWHGRELRKAKAAAGW